MLKKYYDIETNEIYYVGATSDIKAWYKSMRRNGSLCPLFGEDPKFSEEKSVYALCINDDGYFTVVNSDTMLYLIINNLVEEE